MNTKQPRIVARRTTLITWAEADAMTIEERAEAGITTIYSRDRNERGYASEIEADCPCGSVGACNLRVCWQDGEQTECCTHAMEAYGDKDERVPGSYAEWALPR